MKKIQFFTCINKTVDDQAWRKFTFAFNFCRNYWRGLISFGLIGIFIGPVVLAVSFTLLQSWVYEAGYCSNAVTNVGVG